MNKEEFDRHWRVALAKRGISETQFFRSIGRPPTSTALSVRKGTLKFFDACDLFDKLNYEVIIREKQNCD